MRGICDWRDAEFDTSIGQHDDEFRAAPQVEMREQMTDVFPYRNVLKSHFQRNALGRKSANQPRQCFKLSRSQSKVGRVAHF